MIGKDSTSYFSKLDFFGSVIKSYEDSLNNGGYRFPFEHTIRLDRKSVV